MRRVAIAEWILSCTMPQERAGAAAGDLAEVSGELSFWTGLSRCVVSASFRNLAEAPLSFLWTALLLWFAFLVASAIYAFCGWLAWVFLYVFDHHTGLELIADIPFVPPAGLAGFVGLVLLPAAAAWKMGADLARKSPGRELASWYSIVVVWTALGWYAKLPPNPTFLPLLCVLGGMLRMRWVGLRSGSR
jgi:hypothetical protein